MSESDSTPATAATCAACGAALEPTEAIPGAHVHVDDEHEDHTPVLAWSCGRCGDEFDDRETAQRHADRCDRPTMRVVTSAWSARVERGNDRYWCVVVREATDTQRRARRVGHKTHRTEMAAMTCATLLARKLNDEG